MAGGYKGKILFVDLSRRKLSIEPLDKNLCRDFVGGYGLGAKILFDMQKPGIDPLSSDAMLGFVTGPLTGTSAIVGSRYAVVGKSPLTGTWGDANSGGDFGPYLKFAGYDAIFFQGISDGPVYLHINDGKAALKEAGHLWGKDSHDTEEILKSELGKDTRIACIGPSGEKLSLISCVSNNKGRVAGRSGVGAIMGSKKLKAIAVNGKQVVPVAHKVELEEARKKYLEQLKTAIIYMLFQKGGTTSVLQALHMIGEAPTKNWGGVGMVDLPDITAIAAQAMMDRTQRKYGCWRCPISCGGIMKAGTGKYKYEAGVHRPEYETLVGFGTLCLNNDPESIIMVTDICNRYGLDTISAGTTMAFAIECYENGILTDKDTGGIQLRWGNNDAIVAMTEKMARREGLGDILADGVKVAAERIGRGSEQFAMHVKGQEPGFHDPRANISYATAFLEASPGRHTQGNESLIPQGLPLPQFDAKSCASRGQAHRVSSNYSHAMNAAGLCMFVSLCMNASHVPDFLNAVTGSSYSLDDVLKAGERIGNIRHAFNIREGIDINDIKIPQRILGRPPLSQGPTAGRAVDIDTLRQEYFQAMDWDITTGKPSKAKLIELGLEDVARVIY